MSEYKTDTDRIVDELKQIRQEIRDWAFIACLYIAAALILMLAKG
jgi:hypothetical protein